MAEFANVVGKVLLGALNAVVGVMNYFRENADKANIALRGLAGVVGILVALKLAAWIKLVGMALISLFSLIAAHPIGFLIAAIGFLIGVLWKLSGEVTDGIQNWDWWMARIDAAGDNFRAFGRLIKAVAKDAFEFLKTNAVGAANILAGVLSGNVGQVMSGAGMMNFGNWDRSAGAMSDFRDSKAGTGGRTATNAQERAARRSMNRHGQNGPDFGSLDDTEAATPWAEDDPKNKNKKDKAKEFLKNLREWIDDMKHAIAQQKAMNDAILLGARAVRDLAVVQAGENALREKEKAAKEAGVKLTEDQRKEIVGLAQDMEKANQEGTFNQMIMGIHEAAKAMDEETLTIHQGIQGLMLYGEAHEQHAKDMRIEARVRQAMAGIVKEQYETEEKYLKRITEARTEAFRAANQLENIMDDQRLLKSAMDLANSRLTPLENMTRAYESAAAAVEKLKTHRESPSGPLVANADDIRRAQEALERLRPPADMFDAVRQGFRNFMDELKPGILEVSELVKGVANKMVDSFVELAMTGKTSFRELAQSIIGDIMRMVMRALMFKAIMAAGNAIIPGFGSFLQAAGVKHTGGIAGAVGTMRSVDPSIFAGAGRYHKGGLAGMRDMIKPGEVPIIAKQGEAVMPTVRLPDGSFGVKAVGGGSGGTNIFAPNIGITLSAPGGSSGGGWDEATMGKLAGALEQELNVHMQRKLEEWMRPGGMLDQRKR
jgi:predicted RNA binding protein with dsRBD fold (UPF0201 family)